MKTIKATFNRIMCSFGGCNNEATCYMESPSGKAIGAFCDEHSSIMAEEGWKVVEK